MQPVLWYDWLWKFLRRMIFSHLSHFLSDPYLPSTIFYPTIFMPAHTQLQIGRSDGNNSKKFLFIFHHKIIYSGYLSKPPDWGDSNKYSWLIIMDNYPWTISLILPYLQHCHVGFLYQQTNACAIKQQQNMKSWKENYMITWTHLDTETELKGIHTLIHTLISGLQHHFTIILKEIYVVKLAFMF